MITIRKSQSNIQPLLVEYLQGKILVRFDISAIIVEEIQFYNYLEFCFETIQTVQEIESISLENGFVLTPEHKYLIV